MRDSLVNLSVFISPHHMLFFILLSTIIKNLKAKHMMNEQTMSNVKVELNIPGQKLMAQAMEVFDNYQPIVKEALEEAKEKLLFDKDFQQHIKDLVIQRVEDVMKKGVEQAAQTVINEAYIKHYREIEKTVHDAIVSKQSYTLTLKGSFSE